MAKNVLDLKKHKKTQSVEMVKNSLCLKKRKKTFPKERRSGDG